jgi:hypothetical protein
LGAGTPAAVQSIFGCLDVPWWVAGGYAIELAVGRPFRVHSDIDILLLRRDQLAVQHALAGWEWWAADPPGVLRPWAPGEYLVDTVHDIWCRPRPAPTVAHPGHAGRVRRSELGIAPRSTPASATGNGRPHQP